MLNVALWSKFPPSFLSKMEPKLKQRGVVISKYLTDNSKTFDLSDVDAVLFMHEMCGHSEQERLKNIVEPQNKKIFAISRKESFWDRDLASVERHVEMAARKSISNEKLTGFCDDYIKYRNAGLKGDDLVPKLKKYWETGKLTNGHQLNQHVVNLVNSERVPEYFREFILSSRRKAKEQQIAIEQVKEEIIVKPPAEKQSAEDQLAPKSVVVVEKSDWEKFYLDEIAQLTAKADKLETLLKGSDTKLRVVAETLAKNVELGFMSKSDAFDKLQGFLNK